MSATLISGALAAAPPFKDDLGLPCRTQLRPDAWFPDSHPSALNQRAQRLCWEHCARRAECLRWALDTRQPFGVWGGLTAGERADILRNEQGRRS